MRVKTFFRFRQVFLIIMTTGVFLGLILQQAFLSMLVLGFGMVVLSLVRLRAEEVLEDERQASVGEKAARSSFKILMPVLAISSLALISAGGRDQFYYVRALGIVLSYITCLALSIYVIAYWHYNRKYGG